MSSLGAVSTRSLPSTLSGRLSSSSPGPLLTSPDCFPCNTVTTSGSCVRIQTNDTAAVTAAVLAQLDTHAVSLSGLTVLQPSLESAFLQLTDGQTSPTEEVADVA